MRSPPNFASEVGSAGFVFIPSFESSETTQKVLSRFGIIEKLPGLNEIQELTPKNTAHSSPNVYSGNFGYDEFPFHTDLAHWFLPPRYLALRCIEGASDVKTRLVDSREIIGTLGISDLRRALVKPRRPIEMSRPLLRILEQTSEGEMRFRWDSIFIAPCSPHGSKICAAIKELLATSKPLNFTLGKPGDTLIIDNWRMLHARSPVPETQRNRIIHRAYLTSIQ